MEKLLLKALEVLRPDQLWVYPDCGLKTRGWTEVSRALGNMVGTAVSCGMRLPLNDNSV